MCAILNISKLKCSVKLSLLEIIDPNKVIDVIVVVKSGPFVTKRTIFGLGVGT